MAVRTKDQNALYWSLIGRLGLDRETREAMLAERYGVDSSADLNKAEMSDYINWLRFLAGEAAGGRASADP